MANQIVVSSGSKVRDLNDVIIGTSGVLSSLAFNVANGVPKLDVNGKILVSQLPNSVMEYKGTWDASTNTPTLVNGTGNQGDVYLCSVAGTVNFGAGAISFVVSDQVIYSGSIWQKASGSNGTVTSVAVTETGDSLTITGSPITTSGTINIGFAGTNLQYINGAGNLTTFPILTGYVPYTGATTNVTLGTNTLTAATLIVDQGTTGTTLRFKQYGSASYNTNGYTDIYAVSNNIVGFGLNQGSSNFKGFNFNVVNVTLNENRSLYIPDASGTLALTSDIPSLANYVTLNGIQTITGGKTFTSDLSVAKIAIANSNTLYTTTGYTTLSASNVGSTSWLGLVWGNGGGNAAVLAFNNSAQFTYTFPSVSGTMALLEETQTFSGSKTFTSLATKVEALGIKLTTGVVSTGGYLTLNTKVVGTLHSLILAPDSATNRAEFTFDNTALRTYALQNANGTIALLSGTQTFTGATTFSSSVNVQNFLTVSSTSTLLAPSSGKSIEMVYRTDGSNDYAFIQAYDRTAGAYKRLDLNSAITILPTGNVGIGTSSPSYTFDTNKSVAGDFIGRFLNSSSTGYGLYVQTNDNTKPGIRIANASGVTGIDLLGTGAATFSSSVTAASSGTGVPAFYAKADSGSNNGTYGFGNNTDYRIRGGSDYGAMIFDTAGGERMRITSGGDICMGATSSLASARLTVVKSTSDYVMYVENTNATSGDKTYRSILGANTNNTGSFHFSANSAGSDRIYIYGNGNVVNSNNSYGTLSDIKLKENIVDASPKLEDIMKLQVRNFNLKSDINHKQIGFIAQELEQVFPSLIDESPEFDENGATLDTKVKSIKTSVLVPILVKAIQELSAQNQDLKSRLDKAGL